MARAAIIDRQSSWCKRFNVEQLKLISMESLGTNYRYSYRFPFQVMCVQPNLAVFVRCSHREDTPRVDMKEREEGESGLGVWLGREEDKMPVVVKCMHPSDGSYRDVYMAVEHKGPPVSERMADSIALVRQRRYQLFVVPAGLKPLRPESTDQRECTQVKLACCTGRQVANMHDRW